VTLDGRALAKGFIVFFPTSEETGTQVGTFIQDGVYSIARAEGPVPGVYKVIIKSPVDPDAAPATSTAPPDSVPPDAAPAPRRRRTTMYARELIPKKYNAESTLTAQVKRGVPNTFDFDLKN
jgi:hypothetical protein